MCIHMILYIYVCVCVCIYNPNVYMIVYVVFSWLNFTAPLPGYDAGVECIELFVCLIYIDTYPVDIDIDTLI